MANRTKFLLTNISLLLFTLVVVFAVAEICTRAFYDESENFTERRWGELKRKNAFNYGQGVYTNGENGLTYYSSNNEIFKSSYVRFSNNIKKEKPEGQYRVVVLGDSFTACAGVRDKNDCYTWQLEKILNQNLKEEKLANIGEFKVLPLGTGCLNTSQELQLLKEIGVDYDPDFIALQYCPNDISPNCMPLGQSHNGTGMMSKADLLFLYKKDKTFIVPSMASLSASIPINENFERFLLKHSAFMRFLAYKTNVYMTKLGSEPEKSYESVREIGKIAKEKNIPFSVIATPSAYHNESSYRQTESVLSSVKKASQEEQGLFHKTADSLDKLKQIKSELDGSHYNALGNRIMAETLSQDIIDHIKKNKN